MKTEGASKRAIAARRNGRLGGQKTARTHSPEFLEARSSKAGCSTRDRYGIDYYRFIGLKARRRTSAQVKRQAVISEISPKLANLTIEATTADLMAAASAQLKLE